MTTRVPLRELAVLFLRLGLTAFGGPAAHVALMEDEVVQRRKWLDSQRFLDMLGAANLIPGPSSSELAVFIGYETAGVLGLLVAGACFILPAALLSAALAAVYLRYGSLPRVAGVLYGIKPIIIGVVTQAIVALAPKALKTFALIAIALAAGLAAAFGFDMLAVLVVAGLVALAFARLGVRKDTNPPSPSFLLFAPLAAAPASVGLVALFVTFLKVGALVFGSGYVLLAFLREDLVTRLHWLTEAQLVDAVAVGQLTPGPVFTTATFIGYLLAGPLGALVATFAIFLPGFLLVAAIKPLVARVRSSPAASAFLDGVNAASFALMTVVAFQLGRASLIDVPTIALSVVSTVVLVKWRVNPTWLIAGGALIGAVAK